MTTHVLQACPLSWPQGRPRTPAHQRRTATASPGEQEASVAYGVWRVQRELDRLGARQVTVSSDIAPGQAQPEATAAEDPGVCVRFHLDGDAYAVACDRHTTVAANLAAVAKHIEATRAITRHGVASTAETLQAFLEKRGAAPVKSAPKTWRDILGDLHTAQDVAAAFRRLSAERHPDKASGSHKAMAELSHARDEALTELEAQASPAERTSDAVEAFVFEASADFGAMRAAEHFLIERGFSYGRNERGSPRAILFGAHHIAKWRQLSDDERSALDGRMTGDMRKGPVTVTISRAAMARAATPEPAGK